MRNGQSTSTTLSSTPDVLTASGSTEQPQSSTSPLRQTRDRAARGTKHRRKAWLLAVASAWACSEAVVANAADMLDAFGTDAAATSIAVAAPSRGVAGVVTDQTSDMQEEVLAYVAQDRSISNVPPHQRSEAELKALQAAVAAEAELASAPSGPRAVGRKIAGVQRYRFADGTRLRGWRVAPATFFGHAKVADDWGVGVVWARGDATYALNHRGISLQQADLLARFLYRRPDQRRLIAP